MHGLVASARHADQQNRTIAYVAIGAAVAGMIEWAALAGVAHAVLASWWWPEKMAARALNGPMWDGARRLPRRVGPRRGTTS